jgi:hypothetical protein
MSQFAALLHAAEVHRSKGRWLDLMIAAQTLAELDAADHRPHQL